MVVFMGDASRERLATRYYAESSAEALGGRGGQNGPCQTDSASCARLGADPNG